SRLERLIVNFHCHPKPESTVVNSWKARSAPDLHNVYIDRLKEGSEKSCLSSLTSLTLHTSTEARPNPSFASARSSDRSKGGCLAVFCSPHSPLSGSSLHRRCNSSSSATGPSRRSCSSPRV